MSDTIAIQELLTEFEVRMSVIMDKKITVIVHDPLLPNHENFIKITSAVCEFFNIPFTDAFSISRIRPIPEVRFISIYLILKKTKATLLETSKFFSLDHTSAIHARDIVKGRIEINDERTLAAIEYVNKKLYEA